MLQSALNERHFPAPAPTWYVYEATLKDVVALTAAWHDARSANCPSGWTPALHCVGVWHLPQIALWPLTNCHVGIVSSAELSGPGVPSQSYSLVWDYKSASTRTDCTYMSKMLKSVLSEICVAVVMG